MKRKLYLASCAAAALGLGAAGAANASDSITVVAWGGSYTQAQIETLYEPFTAETGINVISEDYNGGLAEVQSQVTTGNVFWDVIEFDYEDVVLGCDTGILEPIPANILPDGIDGTPASEDFLPGAIHECGVANIIFSVVVAYDTEQFGDNPPTTIADFFDLEAFPGRRALRNSPTVALEWALVADGVPHDQVYEVLATPEGVDRAFARLDTIRDSVVWWDAGAQAPQLLADGEVAMTSSFGSRIYTAMVDEGQSFAFMWDSQVLNFGIWGIPAGSPNLEAALEFIAFSTSSEPLGNLVGRVAYGAARQSSMAFVPEDVAPFLPTTPANMTTAIQNNSEFWAEYGDELNERFAVWQAQ